MLLLLCGFFKRKLFVKASDEFPHFYRDIGFDTEHSNKAP